MPNVRRPFRLTSLAIAATTLAITPSLATASAPTVNIVVLNETGVGSTASAQVHIDAVMARVKNINGWNAVGSYYTQRQAAQTWIKANDPKIGILSLGAFLSLRKSSGLEVVGTAEVSGGGGRQYYLVSKSATKVADCVGQTVATNHGKDPKFIDRVISGGSFKLSDFKLVATRRPVQTIKKVIRDEAVCALIDDAQLVDLPNITGGDAVHKVWSSAKLPPMVVVSFPSSRGIDLKGFKASLRKVCAGDGQAACEAAGLQSLAPSGKSTYAKVVKAYEG